MLHSCTHYPHQPVIPLLCIQLFVLPHYIGFNHAAQHTTYILYALLISLFHLKMLHSTTSNASLSILNRQQNNDFMYIHLYYNSNLS